MGTLDRADQVEPVPRRLPDSTGLEIRVGLDQPKEDLPDDSSSLADSELCSSVIHGGTETNIYT
jgi:hypothetical protein